MRCFYFMPFLPIFKILFDFFVELFFAIFWPFFVHGHYFFQKFFFWITFTKLILKVTVRAKNLKKVSKNAIFCLLTIFCPNFK